ncbi:hypothetical protein H0H93_008822 [Arthromyces matolae]|nr:hypothetical protein H0H93_008822 [Arthromyces matolae]
MTSNLYDTLGISQNATTDEIRKAYKKRALQTHPDRLGPGVSDQEKRESEELFRKVNNAYEVLTDPQNRRLYDQCGVWPPPEPNIPDPGRNGSHHPPTGYPSGSRNTFDPWGHHQPFAFTDPFALFDSIFDDMFPDPHRHYRPHRHDASSFAPDLSRMMNDDFFFPRHGFGPRLSDISAFPSFYDHSSLTAAAHGRLDPGQSGNGTGGFQWYSESHHSTTVNGVTQSTHRRRDWNVGFLHSFLLMITLI